MYDRYSLALLLKCGLENITQRLSAESYIPDWASFNLDTEPDGTVYKPDSIQKLKASTYNYTLLGLNGIFCPKIGGSNSFQPSSIS